MIYNFYIFKDFIQFQNGLNVEQKQFLLHIRNVTKWESILPYFDILSYYKRPDIMKWLYINNMGKFTIEWLKYAESHLMFLNAM